MVSTAWVGVRGYLAKGELESAIPVATLIQEQIVAVDVDSVAASVTLLQGHASTAAELTSDPIWRAYEVLPWLGPNLAAVRELASVVDLIAQDAVGPLAAVAAGTNVDSFKPVDGAVDLQPLLEAQKDVAAASTALTAASIQAESIDTAKTLDVVKRSVTQLRSVITTTATGVGALNRAVQVLPVMLGADGPRDYLLMFQNPAELRATGGIAGALALLHTDNGRVELTQQATSADFPRYDSPVLTLTDETRGIYGDITGQFIQDVNLTPDFSTTGALAAEMWRLEFGLELDGVVSLDPVTLSYLLDATGAITLPTGDVLTADNAVQLLLIDVYERYPKPSDQDAFFAAAAASVFGAVVSGDVNPASLMSALVRAGDEKRVLVYSAHPSEQAVLADTTIAGGRPISTNEVKTFGVYLNDGTGSKMDSYLDVKMSVGQKVCRQDGRPEFRVDVALASNAPSDAAVSLPPRVTGDGVYGVLPGNIKTVVSAYGAQDMQNLGLTIGGVEVPYHPAIDASYPVSTFAVELAPGEGAVLSFHWLGAKPFYGDLVVQSTPTITIPDTKILELQC